MGTPLPLSADALMNRAREISGIDRIDKDAIEPLTVLHRAIREEAQLHAVGAEMLQDRLIRILANRLRMQRDFAAHPEIADEEIKAPVVISGLPRSGTTKLHKMLAATGDFNWLPFWQAFNPSLITGDRKESPAPRIEDTERYSQWLHAAAPGILSGHPFETLEPEEETTLLESSLYSTAIIAWMDVPSFIGWTLPHRYKPSLAFLKDALKYLQWQGLAQSGRRWILKSINYLGMEADLLEMFPDAQLIMPHRTPFQTIPSACKLLEQFRKPFSDAPIRPMESVLGFSWAVTQHLALRDTNGIKYLDYPYEQLMRDEIGTIAQVYRYLGMELSDAATARIKQWSAENSQHKHGAFSYSLAEFGLDKPVIETNFAEYMRRFIAEPSSA